jgi:dTDP-glucose 4,6-dehydratase
MTKRILLSGISGFVGAHIFEHLMLKTDWEVVGTYRNNTAGSLSRIDEVFAKHSEWESRLKLIRHDFNDGVNHTDAKRFGKLDVILHVAANSHVDRSITNPMEFLQDNTTSVVKLLEWVRQMPKEEMPLFYFFSTDEVFGPAPEGVDYTEESRHRPNNPYAAAKSAAEQFLTAYGNTYGIPYIISNAMNIIGERQDPEKYVGLCINRVLSGQKLSVHSSPDGKPGKRHYLHARNIAAAVVYLIENGKRGERYNVVGDKEVDNLQMALLIEKYVNEWLVNRGEQPRKLNYELISWHASRPGHDLRYSLNGDKIKTLGFSYPVEFEETLRRVVFWTLDNKERWL